MKKIFTILMSILLIFVMSFNVFATEEVLDWDTLTPEEQANSYFIGGDTPYEEQDNGDEYEPLYNVKIRPKLPDDFSGEINVTFIHSDTSKTYSCLLNETNSYIVFLSLPKGEYTISSFYVTGDNTGKYTVEKDEYFILGSRLSVTYNFEVFDTTVIPKEEQSNFADTAIVESSYAPSEQDKNPYVNEQIVEGDNESNSPSILSVVVPVAFIVLILFIYISKKKEKKQKNNEHKQNSFVNRY